MHVSNVKPGSFDAAWYTEGMSYMWSVDDQPMVYPVWNHLSSIVSSKMDIWCMAMPNLGQNLAMIILVSQATENVWVWRP